MGLLDEAIREHLELKRRHGVSEDQVQREEQEALGPARREQAAAPEDPAAEAPTEVVAPGPAAFAEEGEEPFADTAMEPPPRPEVFHEPVTVEPEHPPQEAALGEAEVIESPTEEPAPAPAEAPSEQPAPEPVVVEPEPEPAAVPGDTPPRGVPAAEPPSEGEQSEDVLEETPEFLQETPEHDRLWFEQKPPRDFDFDE